VAVSDVSESGERRFEVRRVSMPPSSGVESWTVIGPDCAPVAVVDEFLAWLTQIERSPNTVEASARDLKAFWSFLACVACRGTR
jgi:integrase/recombinase XerD